MTWQKEIIDIDPDLNPSQRKEVGEKVIQHILERTVVNSKDRDGRRFKSYSDEYAKTKGTTHVDLTVSGEMLDKLKVISHRKGRLLIGYENGTDANDKAEWNRPDRDFLGIQQSKLKKIMRSV